MVRVAIVGTGDVAHGLAHIFTNNNSRSAGNTLEVTKPGFDRTEDFHLTGIQVCDFYKTLERADVVILAIPAYALEGFIKTYMSLLQGKILVDPTNSWKDDEDLHTFVVGTSLRFVKAFNDIGAVDLLAKHPEMKKRISCKMCSPDLEALETVKSFAETSLGLSVKKVPFEQYAAIAMHQNKMAGGEEWMLAIKIMVGIFICAQIYTFLRYVVYRGIPIRSYPTYLMNKGIAWSCLTGFTLTQVPGVLAHMHNLYYGDSLLTKPKWMRDMLATRKHMGLVSLWMLGVHIFMSCLIFGPNYYGAYFIDPKDALSKMNLNGELAFMCGCFGAALFVIMGICSLPSVAEQMTNRQWVFVFGPVAWAALFFGTFHVIPQGVGITWNHKEKWPKGMPPITLMSTVLPMLVMTMKIVQVLWSKMATKKTYTYGKMGPNNDSKKYDVDFTYSHQVGSSAESSDEEEMSIQA